MKKLKKVTAYLLILRLILSAVLIVPSVSAEEVSPYDYSSFTGDWYCNIQGHTEGISGLYTLSIGGARDNMICLPQMNNAWYPIKDNKVSFSVVPSDELNWTIRHNADVYAIDLTFYDDSICMTAYVKERYLADSIPQDTYLYNMSE